jgi:D-alanyl-D-alanine carboxypeptidase (penicillin-binding protein 5/6)
MGARTARFCIVVAALALALDGAPGAGAAAPRDGTGAYTPAQLAALPASALLVIDQSSGSVLFSHDAGEELAIASTTKLMTTYVTLTHERASARLLEQPYAAGADESLAPVAAGTVLSLADMLRAMLLPSGNNVAYSLSIDVGGSESHFVAMMNAAAAALGLHHTHYTTPIGLDTPGDNYSTASDLARLTRVLMRWPLFRSIVDQPSATLADGVVVDNRNDLVGAYPWIVGVKTGTTPQAGSCLVAAASRNGVHLISVVLGAPSDPQRDADTLALLEYGLSLYRTETLATADRVYASVPVEGRTQPAQLVAQRSFSVTVAAGTRLHAALILPRRLVGPIAAGTQEGEIEVSENGTLVSSVALVTAAKVPGPAAPVVASAAFGGRIGWLVGGGALTAILLGCSLVLVRRRATRSAIATQQ